MKEDLIRFVMGKADECYADDFPIQNIEIWIREFFDQYQPERSKREDFSLNSLSAKDGYFPPPWNPNEYIEKTFGWLEFQKALKEDPNYYCLRCGALNTMET